MVHATRSTLSRPRTLSSPRLRYSSAGLITARGNAHLPRRSAEPETSALTSQLPAQRSRAAARAAETRAATAALPSPGCRVEQFGVQHRVDLDPQVNTVQKRSRQSL